MSNKMALDALTKILKIFERDAFDIWLEAKSPSGDVEQVQRQWESSSEYSEFCDKWADARAAIAALQAEPQGWRQIETAPKDGTDVLLWGLWAGEIHGPNDTPTSDIGRWKGGASDYPGDDWWQLSTGDAYSCWMKPTHWMPLPATSPKD